MGCVSAAMESSTGGGEGGGGVSEANEGTKGEEERVGGRKREIEREGRRPRDAGGVEMTVVQMGVVSPQREELILETGT